MNLPGYTSDSELFSSSSTLSDGASAGLAIGIFLFVMFFMIIMYVLVSIVLGKIFKKAGIESWKAWVPIYNSWILLEMGGQQGFWAILALLPIVNIVATIFMYIAMYNIGLKFGKDGMFVLLAIFLPYVWYAWIAFDSSVWQDGAQPAQVPPTTPVQV